MSLGQRLKNHSFRQKVGIITYAILLFCALMNMDKVVWALSWCLKLLTPLLVGLLFFFLFHPTMRFLEERLFRRPAERIKNAKARARTLAWARPVSLTLAVLVFFVAVGGILALVLPQCVASVKTLVKDFDSNLTIFQDKLNELTANLRFDLNLLAALDAWMDEAAQYAGDFVHNVLPQVFDITRTISGVLVTMLLGLVLGIYLLASKEKHMRQVRMVLEAFLPRHRSQRIEDLFGFTVKTFESYILGQFLEAILLGVLCFVGMTLMGLPHALLISTIIGLTNMIPIVGPLLGVIPGMLVLFVIHPPYALWFLVFILVLQQVENNLIFPRVVGRQVGLSGIWVLLAVTIGGSAFGFVGILLAVPTMTVLYKIAKDNIDLRLKRKQEEDAAEEPEAP